MTKDEIRVATIQFEPKQFEKERNILELLRLIRQAAGSGSKLIVTPEMGTTGYCWYTREEVAPFVETIPGPTTDRFAEVAKEFETHVVLGLPEVDPATGLTAFFMSAEDLIASKLASGRPQDLADVDAIRRSIESKRRLK